MKGVIEVLRISATFHTSFYNFRHVSSLLMTSSFALAPMETVRGGILNSFVDDSSLFSFESSHCAFSALKTRDNSLRFAEVICCVICTIASIAISGFFSTILRGKLA